MCQVSLYLVLHLPAVKCVVCSCLMAAICAASLTVMLKGS